MIQFLEWKSLAFPQMTKASFCFLLGAFRHPAWLPLGMPPGLRQQARLGPAGISPVFLKKIRSAQKLNL